MSSAGKVTNRHLLLWGCLSFSNQKGDSEEVTPQVSMDFVVGLSVGGLGVLFVEGTSASSGTLCACIIVQRIEFKRSQASL